MKLVVVGGGTAGWVTALYAKKNNPENDVTLIESDSIGILGAGEGSVPDIIDFFNFLDIPLEEIIKECKATIKNGIKFSNWSSNKNSFFHPFISTSIFSNDYNFDLKNHFIEQDTAFSHFAASKFNHSVDHYNFVGKLSDKNLVPFFINESKELEQVSSFSVHFDAKLLAQYLQKIGQKRGIKRIEGTVVKIVSGSDGDIEKLHLDNNKEIDVDFIFDCTGFKRLIIGNHFNSKWNSHEKYLPANSALPFILPIGENIPPYTESIAMGYGWMWKIPLQNRYGCGYVFDSNFISEDDAKKEVEDLLGLEIESPKTFKFNAGYYKDIWIKNCLAVGLSAGFLEPLEATSIWQAIFSLKMFFSLPNHFNKNNELTKEKFNNQYSVMTNDIVDFLYLHYVTDKNNTEFWKNFTKNNDMPEFVDFILSIIKERPIYSSDFNGRSPWFYLNSYFYVLIGNNIIDKNIFKDYNFIIDKKKQDNYLEILQNQDLVLNNLISHKQFLGIE